MTTDGRRSKKSIVREKFDFITTILHPVITRLCKTILNFLRQVQRMKTCTSRSTKSCKPVSTRPTKLRCRPMHGRTTVGAFKRRFEYKLVTFIFIGISIGCNRSTRRFASPLFLFEFLSSQQGFHERSCLSRNHCGAHKYTAGYHKLALSCDWNDISKTFTSRIDGIRVSMNQKR